LPDFAFSARIEDRGADASARRSPHVLRVDLSERNATLVDLARACGDFDVRMDHLDVGDYCIDGGVVIERKTYADFAMSLTDGRLFPQVAALTKSTSTDRATRRTQACEDAGRAAARVEGRLGLVGRLVARACSSCTGSRRIAHDPAVSRASIGENRRPRPSTIRPEAEASRIPKTVHASRPTWRRSGPRKSPTSPVRVQLNRPLRPT
jgi:ERCC4 domain